MRKSEGADQEKIAPEGSRVRSTLAEASAGGRCCHDCGIISPETETSYTLISSRYGWRLELVPDLVSGQKISIWRCPDCWRNRRAKRESGVKVR
jgi:hypothetical protein